MPSITVELLAGRSLEQRRAFAQKVTEIAVECLGAQAPHVRIVFHQMEHDEIANGGTLAIDH